MLSDLFILVLLYGKLLRIDFDVFIENFGFEKFIVLGRVDVVCVMVDSF